MTASSPAIEPLPSPAPVVVAATHPAPIAVPRPGAGHDGEAAHAAAGEAGLRRAEAAEAMPGRRPVPPVDMNGAADENPVVRDGNGAGGLDAHGCTAPQLRRFIKSRAYVPMHELRRRFGIGAADDDVTGVDVDGMRIYVGLPPREGRLLGELLRAGDVGYELSMDPITPIVVGVFAMRPVARA